MGVWWGEKDREKLLSLLKYVSIYKLCAFVFKTTWSNKSSGCFCLMCYSEYHSPRCSFHATVNWVFIMIWGSQVDITEFVITLEYVYWSVLRDHGLRALKNFMIM